MFWQNRSDSFSATGGFCHLFHMDSVMVFWPPSLKAERLFHLFYWENVLLPVNGNSPAQKEQKWENAYLTEKNVLCLRDYIAIHEDWYFENVNIESLIFNVLQRIVQSLLDPPGIPHDWLWSDAAEGQSPSLHWKAVKPFADIPAAVLMLLEGLISRKGSSQARSNGHLVLCPCQISGPDTPCPQLCEFWDRLHQAGTRTSSPQPLG